MKGRKRAYTRNVPQHVYQIANNQGVIFYCEEDFILFFTIMCTIARRMEVMVLDLCLMINHVHSLIKADSREGLSAFVSAYTKTFVREYNMWKNRKGALFAKSFGSASKSTSKKIMTCISYIGNNPVLKKLCDRAEEYIWGFIPFAVSANPFSTPIALRNSSMEFRKAVYIVRFHLKRNEYLNYQTQNIIFRNLNNSERRQLIDFIISSYSVINFETAIKYYGSYEKMVMAINSNSGTEYDIDEEYDPNSDKVFEKMITYADNIGYGISIKYNYQNLTNSELKKLARSFYYQVHATELHIAKFLHLPLKDAMKLVHG